MFFGNCCWGCTNAISEEALKKLGLKVESYMDPYHVARITNTKLKVDKQCLVTFEIGNLMEIVMCDVHLLKLCHIVLSRPWIWIEMHTMHTILGVTILTLLLMATRSILSRVLKTYQP
jgi:hypothetical protein